MQYAKTVFFKHVHFFLRFFLRHTKKNINIPSAVCTKIRRNTFLHLWTYLKNKKIKINFRRYIRTLINISNLIAQVAIGIVDSMRLSRILYIARLYRVKSIGGIVARGGGFEAIRTTGPLHSSLGIDATLPAPRIALVRHVELRTHTHTYIHIYAHRYARESGHLASIPPFSGLSRTSCGTSPSTSTSSSDVSIPLHDRRYIRVHMYTECLESCAFSVHCETRSQFFTTFFSKIRSREIISSDCNLYSFLHLYPCYEHSKYSGNRNYN